MTGSQIRSKFLDYFAAREHRVVRSSSLVPANDPTLLFTNAGMNQFKDVFLGQERRDYTRAATSQKCVRAGGKHNDLENVGYTRRHHTFFEMLGNFSFGDYFKAEAIAYAWELITKEYALPKDKLYVTVFREDDEAEELWQKVTGISKSRIFRLDEKDNFWQMGDTGPCGPCSEIHFDLGPEGAEPGREHEEFPLDGGGRFVEIWNLVFMQYDRDSSGKMTPLPKPSIDTGMGLERITAVMQGKITNYETDLIRAIVGKAGDLMGKTCGEDTRVDTVLRINADHARSTAFLINDGIVPSNEGRGYVLRKIMRRAMRNARMIGAGDPYLHKLTGFVAEHMRDAYPEMMDSVLRVARVVKDEEHRYATTFQVAEKFFQDEAKTAVGGLLPGPAAFKLYDTYGLALDEQEDMARDQGLSIDREGFEAEMEKQRTRARASWKGADKTQVNPVYQALPKTEFVGRQTLESSATVTAVLEGEIALERTPFYAEAGGQVGDTGVLVSEAGETVAVVESTYSAAPGKSVHRVKVLGPVKVGDTVTARVDVGSRYSTMRNHTGTHLLHAALRTVLGTHVKQAGSVVEPSRLRFDFSHYTAMDPDELAEVERLMNEQILANRAVVTNVMGLDQALQTGAMALFGEKYGEEVRVVQIDSFSKELCGGTHVERTGDIGICKIVYEGSISAGVRRIEAITGAGALRKFQEAQAQLARVAGAVKASESELLDHVERLVTKERQLEQELQRLKTKMAQAETSKAEPKEVKGVKVLFLGVDGVDKAQLRVMADDLRNRFGECVVVLASATGEVVMGVTKSLTAKVAADKSIRSAGAKGGGRPDMAEGRVQDRDAFLESIRRIVEESL